MRTIEVVDHDRRWSAAFDREAAAMCPVFGDALLTVHHIGSTAVRGLAAKPVIDILVVLRETGSIERFSAAMEDLGYRQKVTIYRCLNDLLRECAVERVRTRRLLTRDAILDYLWGADYVAESNVVDRHIRNLRAKLQNDWRKPRFIATVPGRGYCFLPVFSDPPAPPPD